jgi:hypothetical protein
MYKSLIKSWHPDLSLVLWALADYRFLDVIVEGADLLGIVVSERWTMIIKIRVYSSVTINSAVIVMHPFCSKTILILTANQTSVDVWQWVYNLL